MAPRIPLFNPFYLTKLGKFISPKEVINSNLLRPTDSANIRFSYETFKDLRSTACAKDVVYPQFSPKVPSAEEMKSRMKMSLPKISKLCEKSIYRVLSYRNAPRKKHIEMCRNGFVEGHTDESWKWTLRESDIIRQKGFEYWFYRTTGPYGFRYFQENRDFR